VSIPAQFVSFNLTRRADALAMRERIAAIVASRAPCVPTAREVARALIPHIGVEPPLSIRAIQWHLAQLPQVRALRENR
jgi:hypothetical protein